MKLVLLFFCAILGILIIFFLLMCLSSIKLNIDRCNISNFDKGKKKKMDINSSIYIEFYLLGILKIAKIKITKELISKLNVKTDMNTLKKEADVIKKVHPIQIIKKLRFKIEKFLLDLELGTEDVIITSYAVAILSSLIRNSFGYY